MKYLFQVFVIMFFVFLGEILGYIIPLPIAGSIYGLVLLFIALVTGVVKLSWVADVADWLHGVMPLFFVAPAVAVIDVWPEIADVWWKLVLLLIAAYVITMIATGLTADRLIAPQDRQSKNAKGDKK
ncbi:MAG: CidA/LrgA family protein [Muribaculaceae bacterium]|nr:CidA/LrgA family protein [Muribaculaceae bacterium]